MTVTFQKHTVRVTNKYHCTCGNKFTRQLSDWFTVNPFNTGTPKEISYNMQNKLKNTKRNCPKCKQEVEPKKESSTTHLPPSPKNIANDTLLG